jgi:hypothetical protein
MTVAPTGFRRGGPGRFLASEEGFRGVPGRFLGSELTRGSCSSWTTSRYVLTT